MYYNKHALTNEQWALKHGAKLLRHHCWKWGSKNRSIYLMPYCNVCMLFYSNFPTIKTGSLNVHSSREEIKTTQPWHSTLYISNIYIKIFRMYHGVWIKYMYHYDCITTFVNRIQYCIFWSKNFKLVKLFT